VPTYQYACTECGHELEAVQSFSDAALTTCPECAGKLRKRFSAVGIVFKGSGFYRNDSRSGAGASNAKEPVGATAANGNSSASGSSPSDGGTSNGSSPAPSTNASATGTSSTGSSSTGAPTAKPASSPSGAAA